MWRPSSSSRIGLTQRTAVSGIARAPGYAGYWLVGLDGGVFAIGDAKFLGSHA